MSEDLIVVKVDRARTLLAEARDAGGAKQVADLARAAEVYARRQKLSQEAIGYATAVKVDAMTMMGEFLKAAPKNEGAKGIGTSAVPKKNHTPPTLASNGIGKKESADAQALAALKAADPQTHAAVRAGKRTVAQGVRVVRQRKKTEQLRARAEAAPAGVPPDWLLFCGDAVEGMQARPAGSARLVFADPPYNLGVDYGGGAGADRLPDAAYMAWACRWLTEAVRLLTPDGSLWLLLSWEYACESGVLLKALGLSVRNVVVWNEGFGVQTDNKFARCSRPLFYCVRDPKRFVFNADAALTPSDRQTKYADGRADPRGKVMGDVWSDIPRLAGTHRERVGDFPTQLPLALLRRVVGVASDPGDLVVDPFAGSGTTGEAALEAGRHFLGFEKQRHWWELASLRLRGVTHGRAAG
jgi:DNA modification methylase